MNFRERLKAKVADPIVAQLTQGLSPDKIALTVAVGLCIAVNPIIGTTTAGCLLAAWALDLNQPIIQAINWFSYALQLALIFPFIRLGERIFHAPPETHSLEELVALGRADPLATIHMLGASLGHAFVAWLLVAPLIVGVLYFATRPLFRALARRIPAQRARSGANDVHDVA